MTRRSSSPRPGFSRLDIVRAVFVMAVLVLVLGAGLDREREDLSYPPPVESEGAWGVIGSEADVFRTREAELAVAPDFGDDRRAHVRSMEMYRRLRAYPGAPPRIPHGLTSEEFRTADCNQCHRRGGWVARFGTYAPVTPHPESTACLQCHVPRDDLVGRALPEADDAPVCLQCHVDPDRRYGALTDSDWRGAPWPETGERALPGGPLLVPHRVEARGNCAACHSGPAAVAEIRTDHPERINCRQCHVPAAAGLEAWPPPAEATAAGGPS